MTNEEMDPGLIGRGVRIVAGLGFSVLSLLACATAVVATTDSFAANSTGRVVAVAFFGGIGVICSWFAIRLLLNRPRKDGGLMAPLALRLTGAFFILLPTASLATGAWRNNSIPLPVVLVQGLLYFSWGVSLWRLAARRSHRHGVG